MKFEFLKAMAMKTAVWDVKPCSQNRTEVSDEPARIILTMEASGHSETSLLFYQTSRRHIPQHTFKPHNYLFGNFDPKLE